MSGHAMCRCFCCALPWYDKPDYAVKMCWVVLHAPGPAMGCLILNRACSPYDGVCLVLQMSYGVLCSQTLCDTREGSRTSAVITTWSMLDVGDSILHDMSYAAQAAPHMTLVNATYSVVQIASMTGLTRFVLHMMLCMWYAMQLVDGICCIR